MISVHTDSGWGELTERGTSVSFYPIKKCEYIQQEINVTPELSAYAVSELVRQELQSRKPYQISHVILRGYRDAETELPWMKSQRWSV